MSPSSEPRSIQRPLRHAAVVTVLAAQIAVGSIVVGVWRLASTSLTFQAHPSAPESIPVATPTGWRASAVGSVDEFGNDWFVLMGQERAVRVHIGPDTIVTKRTAPAQYAELRLGATVIVFGDRRPDGALLAHTVVLVGTR